LSASGRKRRALVLGGSGEIGASVSSVLSASGYEVFSVGSRDFDLARSDEIDEYFNSRQADFDVLVHSAGYNVPKEFDVLSDHEIRLAIDANLFGFLNVVRFCLPFWRSQNWGRVVVISSLYGFLSRRGRLPYAMAKHALSGAVKTLAIEFAGFGVLVNSVSPGFIATPMTFRNNSAERVKELVAGVPVGRLGEPDEIARVVEFLCSSGNSYINGQDIVVDGGYSIGGFQS
jgi:NAD(P)-dependent dehydrogenase (short-subunit alcohol dehydrogenase family)